jgi:hypothetical protein
MAELKYLILVVRIPSHSLKFVPRMYMNSWFHLFCLTTYIILKIISFGEITILYTVNEIYF